MTEGPRASRPPNPDAAPDPPWRLAGSAARRCPRPQLPLTGSASCRRGCTTDHGATMGGRGFRDLESSESHSGWYSPKKKARFMALEASQGPCGARHYLCQWKANQISHGENPQEMSSCTNGAARGGFSPRWLPGHRVQALPLRPSLRMSVPSLHSKKEQMEVTKITASWHSCKACTARSLSSRKPQFRLAGNGYVRPTCLLG